jgi:hypothetical protein
MLIFQLYTKRRQLQELPQKKHKKIAPGIPGTMLKEPCLFRQKACGLPAKFRKLAVGAVAAHQKLVVEVETHETHIAGGVGGLVVVADADMEGLRGGDPNKILHFREGTETDTEFLHKITSSAAVQTGKNRV